MAVISNLGYAIFGVSDLARWENFAVDLMGFQVGRRENGRLLTLRMDEYEQRIVLEQGAEDDVRAAGWQIDTEEALDAFADQVRAQGVNVEAGSAELARARRVEKLYVCADPNGFKHEFYFGPAIATSPFRSSVMKGPGFLTGPLGIGHLLPRSIDYKASVSFYRQVLGLKISDYIREEIAPGIVADATFFHSSSGRHHSLATAAIPSDKILNHIMVEVKDMDDVGLAYDRCVKAGYSMVLELGHHPNDKMFSFYVETPSGFAMECGYGGIVIDEANWEVISYSKMSDWGHKRRAPRAVAA
ncbi:VOC family protein [Polaromonas hydrogenivorans]|uniref:VOC family protein n=1 Tax=Polaromonas hydrogenivorans TaxID=335476 RepID=A0AAU7LZV5_9BURK